MDDRKLLELAARAAGLQGAIYANSSCGHGIHHRDGIWNPLINDGDALQLAVKLGIEILFTANKIGAGRHARSTHASWVNEDRKVTDPYAATRRAIVRAAAAIGQEMK